MVRISPWAHRHNPISHQTLPCRSSTIWRPAGRLALRLRIASKHIHTTAEPDSCLFKYAPIEDVEKLEFYRPGGYHPITIGDVLQSQYQVVHKLGYGTFSTTWLCRDSQSSKYVAVKVGTANSNTQEVETLESLQRCRPCHPYSPMMPCVYDRFLLRGPNGTHPCYVTAPAMCSLFGAKDASYRCVFQANVARSLIAQLVLAVEYLHARGIAHGDIHPGNVLLRLPDDIDQLSIDQLYEKYRPPASEPIIRLDGQPLDSSAPPTAVYPIWLGKASEKLSLSECRIWLSDFGEAFRPSTERRVYSRAPLSFVPPEARFEPERGLAFSADIWTLACTVWIILGQRPLFEDILATMDDITAEQVDTLGKLPLAWWEKWEARNEYFDGRGEPNQGRQVRSWEDRFEKHIQLPREETEILKFDGEEKAAVLEMLRCMLSFDPEQRSTVHDVVRCEWMEKWALPILSNVA